MTRKTKISFGLLALAALVCGFFLGMSPAHAQSAVCAPSDLACRVSALEARLAELEGRQTRTEARAADVERAMPNLVTVQRRCATNCEAEAQAVCVERGFASGTPEDWSRDRGATSPTLTSANCQR
jgi:hypothetical protein